MAILLALSSALTYGIADFAGGSAARRARPLAVTVGAQAVGTLVLPLFLLLVPGEVSVAALAAGAGAGLFGGTGLALYFTAMRDAAMGVVAPLSSVSAAVLPVVVGLVGGERPAAVAWVGIAVGLPAIYLAAASDDDGTEHLAAPPPGVVALPRARSPRGPGHRRGVLLGVLSGAAFGCFFVLLDAAPTESGAWPLVGSRAGGLVAVGALLALRRTSPLPARGAWGLVLLSGMTDSLANLLFLLATRAGLLTLVSVISSQYPVVVVLLSLVLLRERLRRSQQLGVGLALVGVALISLG